MSHLSFSCCIIFYQMVISSVEHYDIHILHSACLFYYIRRYHVSMLMYIIFLPILHDSIKVLGQIG